MRKKTLKALKSPRRTTAKDGARPALNGRTRATNGSTTRSGGSAHAKGRGKTSPDNAAPPNDPRLDQMMDRALALKNAERFEEAADAFGQITACYPNFAPAHGMRGLILFSALKRPQDAILSFQEAVRLAPKSELASLGLFHSLWKTGREDDAFEEMKRYQSLNDWSCQDYLDIVAEINHKKPTAPRKKAKSKK